MGSSECQRSPRRPARSGPSPAPLTPGAAHPSHARPPLCSSKHWRGFNLPFLSGFPGWTRRCPGAVPGRVPGAAGSEPRDRSRAVPGSAPPQGLPMASQPSSWGSAGLSAISGHRGRLSSRRGRKQRVWYPCVTGELWCLTHQHLNGLRWRSKVSSNKQ